jgi:uncharacterized protein YjbI with pentapeptide repeats
MEKEQLKEVLEKHSKWLQADGDGERANLRGANLTRANLRGANLIDANLIGANLTRANLPRADLSGADLSGANLTRANLRGANLPRADLSGADLSGANLTRANLPRADLSGANLTRANLTRADLSGANLTRANLTRADLSGADLIGANLTRANLRGANLIDANLIDANLTLVKEDYFRVLEVAKDEVLGLYDALMRGLINGSTYTGECACLVGTIANIRHERHDELNIDLRGSADRPAERWFLAIREGDTPQNNPISDIVAKWTQEFLDARQIKYPRYKIVAVTE